MATKKTAWDTLKAEVTTLTGQDAAKLAAKTAAESAFNTWKTNEATRKAS